MVFQKITHFLKLFAVNLMNTIKRGSLHEKFLVLAESMSFNRFSQNPTLLATCLKHGSFLETLLFCLKRWLLDETIGRPGLPGLCTLGRM